MTIGDTGLEAHAIATARAQRSAVKMDRIGDRWRQRRIVWNNDGSDLMGPAFAGGKWTTPVESAGQFIDTLMRFVEGTQVDAVFFCGFVNEADWEVPRNNIEVLGPNPSTPVVDFAHDHNMEFFWSIRMNDVHSSRHAPKRAYWSPFRRDHPELLLANVSRDEWDRRMQPWIDKFSAMEERRRELRLYEPVKDVEREGQSDAEHPLLDVFERNGQASPDLARWAGFDWSRPEVQDHYLGAIVGACERYDLDGIELDWCRHGMFFPMGRESQYISVMNDFVHAVHNRLTELGKARGRPILLAHKVPDSVEVCLACGLDPETWLRRGWVDLLMAGGGVMPFSIDMGAWTELGHRYDVPVYGSLDRLYSPFRFSRPKFDHRDPYQADDPSSGYDCVAAASHRFWEAGVDGIYLYDWHTHHGPTDPREYGSIPRVGDPADLVRHDKLYCIDLDWGPNGALSGYSIRGQLPLTIPTRAGDAVAELSLDIAEDLPAATQAALQVRWEREIEDGRATWRVNGVELTGGVPFVNKRYGTLVNKDRYTQYGQGAIDDPGWATFSIDPAHLSRGANIFEVTVRPAGSGQSPDAVTLEQARVWIGYG